MGTDGTTLEQAALVVQTPEQVDQAENPYRKITTKLEEISKAGTVGEGDSAILHSLAGIFEAHREGLSERANFLRDQGIDPQKRPDVFFDLLNDSRNPVFYPGGVVILPNKSWPPSKEGGGVLSQEAARKVLEELGFMTPDESLHSTADKVKSDWKRADGVLGFYYDKVDPESGSRVNLHWDDEQDAPNARGMLWIRNNSLGEGVTAGIEFDTTRNPEGKITLNDHLKSVTIRVEEPAPRTAPNLLKCAP